MATFKWDSTLELGIPFVDEQHKALFGWVDALNDSVRKGDGSEAVGDVIWKLITYVTEHFAAEEQLMLTCGYPALDSHRKEHNQFVGRLRKIQVEYIDGQQMSESVLEFLVDWLVCHIKGTDQGYRRFVQKQKGEA